MGTKLIVLDHHEFNLEEECFFLNGEEYEYFLAYGKGGLNERIVEIPLICKYINSAIGKNVLEVGAVISLMIKGKFDVVDLSEKGPGIVNVDIVNYHPSKRYDLIFSISTIEHFGNGDYGEEKKPLLLQNGLDNIISLLAKNGIFAATAPIGWSQHFDKCLIEKSLPFQEIYYMKRNSPGVWKQVGLSEAINTPYNIPHPYANAMMIGVYKK